VTLGERGADRARTLTEAAGRRNMGGLASRGSAAKLAYRTGKKASFMIVGRVLGWALLVAGLVLLGRDLLGWLDTRRFAPETFGHLWLDLAPASLASLQAHLPQRLWDAVATPALAAWAWPVLLALGVALVALCRPRLHGRRRHR
jgi:hypothetical protein